MIDWKKYDPKNPPNPGKYLVSDGKDTEIAIFDGIEWDIDGGISHYSEINQPDIDERHYYHVVYNYENESGVGFGTCTIIDSENIKTTEDIKNIKRHIENEFKLKNVIILNWIKLEG